MAVVTSALAKVTAGDDDAANSCVVTSAPLPFVDLVISFRGAISRRAVRALQSSSGAIDRIEF